MNYEVLFLLLAKSKLSLVMAEFRLGYSFMQFPFLFPHEDAFFQVL
jgi:hypothetical protein